VSGRAGAIAGIVPETEQCEGGGRAKGYELVESSGSSRSA
jgi:hypothetical protein